MLKFLKSSAVMAAAVGILALTGCGDDSAIVSEMKRAQSGEQLAKSEKVMADARANVFLGENKAKDATIAKLQADLASAHAKLGAAQKATQLERTAKARAVGERNTFALALARKHK